MSAIASQTISLTIVYSTIYSDTDQKKTPSKFRVTGLCAGNSPVTGELPSQRASNAENVSIWWRHHEIRRPWDRLIFVMVISILIRRHRYIKMASGYICTGLDYINTQQI